MNKTQKRIVVPPSDEIVAMRDDELISLRAELVEAQQLIEVQVRAARDVGGVDSDWLIRSNGALAHFRRGLSVIKGELLKRGVGGGVVGTANSVNAVFEHLDAVRSGLRAYAALHAAVVKFLDDDSDEHFAELERLVGDG